MALGDQFRSGPNQDINDPTSLIELSYVFQQTSDSFGDFLRISDTQNLDDFDGDPIVNVSIPLLLEDGSTSEYFASGITTSGEVFIYDTSLWATALIITHINLPERFRDYWAEINNTINQLNNFVSSTDIPPEGPVIADLGDGRIRTHGSLGGEDFDLGIFDPTSPYDTPSWSGSGPVNYNSGTYPQLLNEITNLNISLFQQEWDTIYLYDSLKDSNGSVLSLFVSFGKGIDFVPPQIERWIQIYNYTEDDIDIDIDGEATIITGNAASGRGVFSIAEIRDLNDFPPNLLLDSSYSSYDIATGSGPGSVIYSRTVTVPSEKSVFIKVRASIGTTFGSPFAGNVSVEIEDQAISDNISV